MPPDAVPPEIDEPSLPGEHSPVRDPQRPNENKPKWSRTSMH
jgi:hypothetical protein